MVTSTKTATHAGLSRLLHHHADAGTIQRKLIQHVADTSQSTAWRWFEGTALPDLHELHLMLKDLPAAAADGLLALLLEGTCYTFARRPDCETDLDGDGRTTARDFLQQVACNIGGAHQRSLDQVIQDARDNKLSPEEAVAAQALLLEMSRQIEAAKLILTKAAMFG